MFARRHTRSSNLMQEVWGKPGNLCLGGKGPQITLKGSREPGERAWGTREQARSQGGLRGRSDKVLTKSQDQARLIPGPWITQRL